MIRSQALGGGGGSGGSGGGGGGPTGGSVITMLPAPGIIEPSETDPPDPETEPKEGRLLPISNALGRRPSVGPMNEPPLFPFPFPGLPVEAREAPEFSPPPSEVVDSVEAVPGVVESPLPAVVGPASPGPGFGGVGG